MADERVQVRVWLDRRELEDLELLVAYRHGGKSRSEVVRSAISWLRSKEAGWLMRARRYEQLRQEREEADSHALAHAKAERDRRAVETLVGQALDVVRRGD